MLEFKLIASLYSVMLLMRSNAVLIALFQNSVSDVAMEVKIQAS